MIKTVHSLATHYITAARSVMMNAAHYKYSIQQHKSSIVNVILHALISLHMSQLDCTDYITLTIPTCHVCSKHHSTISVI